MASKKPIITYHDEEQGSEQWKIDRDGMFTGSNAYKLLTSFGAGSHAVAHNDSFAGNWHTKRGHILEDEAAALYEIIKDVTMGHTGYATNSLYPNALYSPDGFLDDRTVEIKCFSPKVHLATLKRLTLEIQAQVHFGQLIMDKKLTDLVLYCPQPKNYDEALEGPWPVPIGLQLVIRAIKRNPDIQNNFKQIIGAVHG